MDREELEFVHAALPKGRTIFYDFEDRYAVLLLSHALRKEPCSISDLKRSHLAPLLNKPVVKQVLSQLGRAQITAQDLLDSWPASVDAYRLTLDSWPSLDKKPRRSWHQVTRHGYSLVLQLNLPIAHKRELDQTIKNWQRYTSAGFHPVAKADEVTLAWARIDLDLARGEALIEEVQSDWVRDVRYYAESNWVDNRSEWQSYYTDYLEPRAKHWPRTTLAATLWFLLEELGIKTVFFHTHASGMALKRISEAMLLASAIPLLAVTYVAGIIWDRIVDAVFEKLWVDRWRPAFFDSKADYYNARRAILTKSERLSELIEYGRSRMRICRAWSLNALLITMFGVAFIFRNHRTEPEFGLLVLAVTLIGTAFSAGAWYAWASLVKTEYRKIKDQSEYLSNDASAQ